MPKRSLPETVPRAAARKAGMTRVGATPLSVQSKGVELEPALADRIRRDLGRRIERFAQNVTRVGVSFKDINGPRGGVDTVCRVRLSVKGVDPIVIEAHGVDAEEAFRLASKQAQAALGRLLERMGPSRRRPLVARAQPARRPAPKRGAGRATAGSLIGRRVGRARENLEAAWAWSGEGSTAARNARLRAPKATATLEDSARTRPSRKSTRKSAERSKSGSKLGRRTQREHPAPSARAARA